MANGEVLNKEKNSNFYLVFEFHGPEYLELKGFFLLDITFFKHFCPGVEFFQVNFLSGKLKILAILMHGVFLCCQSLLFIEPRIFS